MNWIDRNTKEPDKNDRIVIWHDGSSGFVPVGLVAVRYDNESWVDVVDGNEMNFRYWMKPEEPIPLK